MIDGLTTEQVIEKLDAISRKRALTIVESLMLEKAIRSADGEPDARFTKRDAARAGLKRDMPAYRRASQ